MIITKTSPLTGEVNSMDLPVTPEQLAEMARPRRERRMVQEIFPHLTAAQREFIQTGYTPEDWAAIFPEEAPASAPPSH